MNKNHSKLNIFQVGYLLTDGVQKRTNLDVQNISFQLVRPDLKSQMYVIQLSYF
jgi:hypothetical protein